MNWSDGSVLVDGGTQFWGTCFSTTCKLELLSEVTLSFFCLNMGNQNNSCFGPRFVIKLYAGSFITELCTFYDRMRIFFHQSSQAYLETFFLGKKFPLWLLGLLHTRVTGFSFKCLIPLRSVSMQFRHFSYFGTLYGSKFFTTKSSLHGSMVSTTLTVRGQRRVFFWNQKLLCLFP